ncbi:hypothetical protein [Bradyrhizobium sp.]|uniref:hypothetical protein n=1 Tax=Bradyrhizobium sp. TaxID=376 RepID=UPI00263338D4|nr:hypothetical protein [Bradyrhizobium sp.]
MNQLLWELPVPSSSQTKGPTLNVLVGRECEIAYYIETDDGDRKEALIFEGVEAFKTTYMTARSVDMIEMAYDRLVRIEASPWLAETTKNSDPYYQSREGEARKLQHLMICFDDGPCYEFICAGFKVA